MRIHLTLLLTSAALTLVPLSQAADSNAVNSSAAKNSAKKSAQKSQTYTVYAAGDIADCKKKPAPQSMAARTADIIVNALDADKNAFAITLGDNTYPVGKPEEFSNCYDPTWGRFKERTLPSPGNHDYAMPKALGYYNYFGDIAGPERRGYYAKNLGNWHILSLNSNVNAQEMQKQLAWLQTELSNSKQACTLAFWHHPAYSSGGHGNNENMKAAWKILAQAKADIVLSGHDHDYERFAPMNENGDKDEKNGIRNFVVGTGGAKLTPMFLPKSTTEIRDNSSNGVLKLTLHDKSYEWEFIPVAGESFNDKGQGSCH
ncbi:metallophosphoesterase [Undibacterium jejuense]|uniref:Metallophosphoesterase n=1 Tax=Undibacterium jejuense TaxID=1344949 RepID=A0A923KL64_9BURK|nr:metallophosphoesterase [Undibacterium jejuense]MBC3862680.1 metallophosphoesterase [Undibacterium jejuense]